MGAFPGRRRQAFGRASRDPLTLQIPYVWSGTCALGKGMVGCPNGFCFPRGSDNPPRAQSQNTQGHIFPPPSRSACGLFSQSRGLGCCILRHSHPTPTPPLPKGPWGQCQRMGPRCRCKGSPDQFPLKQALASFRLLQPIYVLAPQAINFLPKLSIRIPFNINKLNIKSSNFFAWVFFVFIMSSMVLTTITNAQRALHRRRGGGRRSVPGGGLHRRAPGRPSDGGAGGLRHRSLSRGQTPPFFVWPFGHVGEKIPCTFGAFGKYRGKRWCSATNPKLAELKNNI